MPSETLSQLAESIVTNTTKVSAYIAKEGLPQPSFDVDGPTKFPVSPETLEIEGARMEVIRATQELNSLMLGPTEYLFNFSANEVLSLQAITRFKIATSFKVKDEASFAHIAEMCGLGENDTRRLIRHAISHRIFREPRRGFVAHNAVSRVLAENAAMLDWMSVNTDEIWQAAAQTVNAMCKYPGSEEPNETGFCLANNTENSIYQELGQYPERARRFGSAMSVYTDGPGFDHKYIVEGYDWAALGAATVVDVGGSHGSVCLRLATAFPLLRLINQDLPSVIDGAPEIHQSVEKRVKMMKHDFFETQPVEADVYLLRWILHNWSDKYAMKILQALIPSLKPGAHIIINDNVMPSPGILPSAKERTLRAMDLTMLELQNARERELDDWVGLLRKTDERFRFVSSKQPQGSNLWVIEVVWDTR